jgi:lipopolysaccharide transport system ATP-binding protein
MSYVVRFDGVTKRYRKGERGYASLRDAFHLFLNHHNDAQHWTVAVKDLSFEVEPGEVFGIVGPNGSGKSTILRLMYRTTFPTEGMIRIRGRVGALIEIGSGLHPELTGKENVFFYGQLLGMSRREVAGAFSQIAEFSEIAHMLDTPTKRYSAGMQLRLWFSIVSHLRPELLLVDETLSVGDAAFQKKCSERMHEMLRSGSTIILVSHDMSLIERLCTRVMFLLAGQMGSLGAAPDAVDAYRNWVHRLNGGSHRSYAAERGELAINGSES